MASTLVLILASSWDWAIRIRATCGYLAIACQLSRSRRSGIGGRAPRVADAVHMSFVQSNSECHLCATSAQALRSAGGAESRASAAGQGHAAACSGSKAQAAGAGCAHHRSRPGVAGHLRADSTETGQIPWDTDNGVVFTNWRKHAPAASSPKVAFGKMTAGRERPDG